MDTAAEDFRISKLSLVNVFSFTEELEKPLTFAEMWYRVFLWALFSSIFVHFIAASIAFMTLQKHKLGRFVPMIILIMGTLGPLSGGVLISSAIACVYRAANSSMDTFYIPAFWGVGQTVLAAVLSFTRILATL